MNPAPSRPYTSCVAEVRTLSALDEPPPGGPLTSSEAASSTRSSPRAGPGPESPRAGRVDRAGASDEAAAAGRRAILGLTIGAVVVGVLCLLDYLPALYAAIVAAHVWIGVRWRRRPKGARPDEVRITPTPVGILVLAFLWVLLLCAVFLPSPSFRLLASLLFACATLGWPLSATNLGRVRVTRSIAPRARVDARTALEFVAVNPTRRAAESLRLEDDLGLAVKPASIEVALDSIAGGDDASARVSVTFQRRGWRRLRPVRISSTYPLGIFAATRDTDAPARVLVHPMEGTPTAALLARLRGRSRDALRGRTARAGADEFQGLREFREGDDPRRIHWATSARRGAPTFVVREEEPARRVIVALAACRAKDRTADLAFERAVSGAAGILRAALRAGCRPTLVLSAAPTGEAPGVVALDGPGDLVRALDALAVVKADGGRDPRAAFSAAQARWAHATLLWISATPEGAREIPGLAEGIAPRARLRLRADEPSFARFVTVRP